MTMKLSAAALSIVLALAPEPVHAMRLLEISVDPNASAASMRTHSYVVGRGGDRDAALLRGGATGTSVSMHGGAAAVVAGVGVVFLAALAGVAATRRPKTFPGPRGVIADKSDIHAHLQVIFGLMVQSGVHVEAATRSRRYNNLWRGIFDDYFGSTGQGRNFEMWDNRAAGLIKFRTSVMTALQFHADAYTPEGALTGLLMLLRLQAHDIMVARNAAIATDAAAAAAAVAHRGALDSVNRGMGLLPPGRGVEAPPNPESDLTREQQEALRILSSRTRSINRQFVLYIIFFYMKLKHCCCNMYPYFLYPYFIVLVIHIQAILLAVSLDSISELTELREEA